MHVQPAGSAAGAEAGGEAAGAAAGGERTTPPTGFSSRAWALAALTAQPAAGGSRQVAGVVLWGARLQGGLESRSCPQPSQSCLS